MTSKASRQALAAVIADDEIDFLLLGLEELDAFLERGALEEADAGEAVAGLRDDVLRKLGLRFDQEDLHAHAEIIPGISGI